MFRLDELRERDGEIVDERVAVADEEDAQRAVARGRADVADGEPRMLLLPDDDGQRREREGDRDAHDPVDLARLHARWPTASSTLPTSERSSTSPAVSSMSLYSGRS